MGKQYEMYILQVSIPMSVDFEKLDQQRENAADEPQGKFSVKE